MNKKSPQVKVESLKDLYNRPGFLLRRAHQIAVSIFLAEAEDMDVTTTQYGVLFILQRRENLDQRGLSKLVGLDRSTTALVVGKLEAAGHVVRVNDPVDGRRKVLVLTPQGSDLIKSLTDAAERTRLKELSVFSASEAKVFLALLQKFVDGFNHIARAPIQDTAKIAAVRTKAIPGETAGKKKKAPAPKAAKEKGRRIAAS